MALTTIVNETELAECIAREVALVVFWTPWSQPCQMQLPILEQLTQDTGQTVMFCRIDVEAHDSLARQYEIEGLPTLILFKNGVIHRRFVGVQTAEDLLAAIKRRCD